MMRLAPTRNSIDHAAISGGLLLRMRSWFATVLAERCAQVPHNIVPHQAPPAAIPADSAQTAMLLPFPIRGEALLVKLAELLRTRAAGRNLEQDPLLLEISRRSHARMSIDQSAYVEFHANGAIYHVVVEAMPDTTIKVETTDFDTVVKFVLQYVDERLAAASKSEVAS
jgi:hypothetical protein